MLLDLETPSRLRRWALPTMEGASCSRHGSAYTTLSPCLQLRELFVLSGYCWQLTFPMMLSTNTHKESHLPRTRKPSNGWRKAITMRKLRGSGSNDRLPRPSQPTNTLHPKHSGGLNKPKGLHTTPGRHPNHHSLPNTRHRRRGTPTSESAAPGLACTSRLLRPNHPSTRQVVPAAPPQGNARHRDKAHGHEVLPSTRRRMRKSHHHRLGEMANTGPQRFDPTLPLPATQGRGSGRTKADSPIGVLPYIEQSPKHFRPAQNPSPSGVRRRIGCRFPFMENSHRSNTTHLTLNRTGPLHLPRKPK